MRGNVESFFSLRYSILFRISATISDLSKTLSVDCFREKITEKIHRVKKMRIFVKRTKNRKICELQTFLFSETIYRWKGSFNEERRHWCRLIVEHIEQNNLSGTVFVHCCQHDFVHDIKNKEKKQKFRQIGEGNHNTHSKRKWNCCSLAAHQNTSLCWRESAFAPTLIAHCVIAPSLSPSLTHIFDNKNMLCTTERLAIHGTTTPRVEYMRFYFLYVCRI